MITLLLVDDDALVRETLRIRLSLEPDLLVLDEAEDGQEALNLAEALHPDIVVMDVRMPGMGGIAATERLHEIVPSIVVVMCSNCKRSDIEAQAIAAGAAAFVDKMAPVDHLLNVIRQVVS